MLPFMAPLGSADDPRRHHSVATISRRINNYRLCCYNQVAGLDVPDRTAGVMVQLTSQGHDPTSKCLSSRVAAYRLAVATRWNRLRLGSPGCRCRREAD